MFKSLKFFLKDMFCDVSNHINSKIVLGVISFIVAVIMGFLKTDIQYVIAFLTFSASAVGFSCFDNNSAFKFQRTESKTETINKDTKLDIAETIKNIKKKK